jgi:DNA-binding transcriptional LysR family regulator
MDRFESMSTFVAVVEAGGFSAASRRLAMPLATVSRKVSELEDQLGVRLLNRSTRQVTLTESGEQFFAACRRILDDLGEAERAASGEYEAPRGELVITAPIVFGRLHVLPIVAAFLKTCPQVTVRLLLADRVVSLIEEQVDLAVRIGRLPDSSMVATRIGSIGYVTCASPKYLADRGTPSHPKELAGHDCITFMGIAAAAKEWSFKVARKDIVIPVQSRLVVTTAEAAIDAAVAGIGITRVLSYQVADAVKKRRLTLVLRDFEPEPYPASLIYPSGRHIAAKLRAFLDFAVPRLRARLSPR